MSILDLNVVNIANLAYIGDSVYELNIRNYLVINLNYKVNILQKKAKDFVSAKSQAKILDHLIEDGYFTLQELELIKRARNFKPKSKPRYTNIIDYKKATALEVLFGFLYLSNNFSRINELINKIVEEVMHTC